MTPRRGPALHQGIDAARVLRAAGGIGAGAVVAAGVTVGVQAGPLGGPLAIVILGVVLLAIPSARRLSTRFAINGGVALGVIPILWWLPWPPGWVVGRSSLLVGLSIGALLAVAVMSSSARTSILRPRLSWADLALPAAAAFCAWFFLPFFRVAPTLSSVAMVMQSFGNDNVAHFDMFEMIRKYGVAGPGWPAPSNGSVYAYVPYPQAFHSFAAFTADLWGGAQLGSVGAEVRLFGIASAVSISLGLLVLVGALTAIPLLRRHQMVLAVMVASVASLFLLGPGAQTLSYGFPNFLLALLASVTALVLCAGGPRTSFGRATAAVGLVVFVAHSWILLAPIAAVGPALALVRAPWLDRSKRLALARLVVVSIVGLGGVGYAAFLVLLAVRSAGGPAEALATGGGVSLNYPPVTLATAGFCLAGGVILTLAARAGRASRRLGRAGLAVGVFGAVSLAESIALIVVQLRQADSLDYFQHKFLDGVQVMATTALALVICLGFAYALDRIPGRTVRLTWSRRAASVVATLVVVASIVTFVGLPFTPSTGLTQYKAHGLDFRRALYLGALYPRAAFGRQLHAATVMATQPCKTPVYLAGLTGDFEWAQANQWAMSFSSTWTETSAPITHLLAFSHQRLGAKRDPTVVSLLGGHPTRCLIVAPQTRSALSASTLRIYGDRIITWGP